MAERIDESIRDAAITAEADAGDLEPRAPYGDATTARLRDLRSNVRSTARAMRRIAEGGRGLGPGAVTDWLSAQAASRREATAAIDERDGAERSGLLVENSSLTWVVADERRTTWIWLHNYWSDAYGIPELDFDALLFDTAGREIAAWPIRLARDATETIDLRVRARRAGAALPFEGHLLLRARHERLIANRPVQVFAEYVSDDGHATGVHGGYGVMDTPAAQIVGTMRAEPAPATTWIIATNPFAANAARRAMRAELVVWSAAGARRSVRLPGIAPMGMARVSLADVVPDLDQFLGGRAGAVALKLPCPSSRVATVVERGDGVWIANHGTIDRVFDQGHGAPLDHTHSWPVVSTFVVTSARRDTRLLLTNRWGPVAAAYDAHLDIHGPDGSLLVSAIRRVERDSTTMVSARQLLADAGIMPPSRAQFEIRLLPCEPVDELPAQFDVLAAVYDDHALMGEVQVGSGYFNAEVPSRTSEPDIRRTRVFTRIRGGAARTTIMLTNPAGRTGYDHTATPRVTLLDPTGRVCETTELAVPPHGSVAFSVEELFTHGARSLAANGWGAIRVRDVTCRLFGFHLTERSDGRSVVVDHLVGG